MSTLFAIDLKMARINAGKTQAQLAELLGLAKSSISLIESGARETTTDVVERWLVACSCTITIAPSVNPVQLAELMARIERVLLSANAHQMQVFEALVLAMEHQMAKKV